MLLGNRSKQTTPYSYTTITLSGAPFKCFTFDAVLSLPDPSTARSQTAPQPRSCNACQLSHTTGLASSAFARHYSRNHNCFLFLRVLRCFTSPRSLQHPYRFKVRSPDMTPVFRGFPIRTSTDQSSFTNSPWLIAGYNVLHRLLMPRHPPIALSSLSPKIPKQKLLKDARVHYTILKQHTPTPQQQKLAIEHVTAHDPQTPT